MRKLLKLNVNLDFKRFLYFLRIIFECATMQECLMFYQHFFVIVRFIFNVIIRSEYLKNVLFLIAQSKRDKRLYSNTY